MSAILRAAGLRATGLRAIVAASVILIVGTPTFATPSLETALSYPESVETAADFESVTATNGDDAVELTSACEPSCDGCCDTCGDSCSDECCSAAVGCCGAACGCDPVWFVKGGAVILHRARPAAQTLIVPLAGPGTISSGDDFGLGWDGGLDVSIARRSANGDLWEVRYFGDLDWDADAAPFGGVGNVRIGSFSNFGATALTGRYASSLDSVELNWRRPIGQRARFLAGYRQFELKDDITHNIVFPAFNADYNWHETNHLYGAQFGGDFDLWRLDSPLSVNALLKGGIYGNVANNDFTLRPSTGGQFDGGGKDSVVAFAGEIDVTAAYQLTRHMALRGGYQLLWRDGVALARDNMARATRNSSQAGIDNEGDVFYHGALMSLDFMW